MARDGSHLSARPWIRRSQAHLGLAAIGLALAWFCYATYRGVEEDLSQAAISGRSAISVLAASTLTQDFRRFIDVGRSLSSRVRFGEMVAVGRWSEAAHIMGGVLRDFPIVDQVLISDAEGVVQATVTGSESAPLPLPQPDGIPLSVQPVVSDVYPSIQQGPGHFMVALPVMGPERRPLAMLTLRVSTQRFLELFAQLQLEPQGMIQVIDRRGQLAFDSARPTGGQIIDMSGDSVVQRVLEGEAGVDLGSSSRPDVVAFAPTSFGWGVLARWPQQTVFAARDAQLRRVVFACAAFAMLLALAFGLLLQLAVARRQTSHERRANVELESRVRERTAQLEQANVDLESFSYSVSHDLRAPLRAIDGYVTVLYEDHKEVLGGTARRSIDNVHRNVQHMSRLIDELLELARVGRITLREEQIDMTALVNEILPGVIGTRSNVSVDVQPLPPIRADVTLIRQVWVNLLDNAVKYSSQVPSPQIKVSGQAQTRQVTYCVADNGVGFDMQHYDRLFKPFSRLHSPGEFTGTGVGLALVKRIIERYEGRVWAESVPNLGTKVFFSLPNRG